MGLDRSAFLVLLSGVLCSVLAVYSFFWIRKLEQPSSALIGRLQVGKKTFQMKDGERCLGGLETELREDPGLVFTMRGNFRVSLRGEIVPVRIFIGAFFNSLSQLVSSNFELESGGRTILVTSSQPNPVLVRLAVNQNGSTSPLRDFSIPGPIEMLSNGDSSYRVSYSGLQGNTQRLLQQLSQVRGMTESGEVETFESFFRLEEGNADGYCGLGENVVGKQAILADRLLTKLPFLGDPSALLSLSHQLNPVTGHD